MGLKTIVVGLDRSPTAADALKWALRFSQTLDADITAVSTWQMPLAHALPSWIEGRPTVEVMATQCTEALAHTVAEAAPDAAVSMCVIEGKPGPSLVDAAADADLLVVGRTGQGARHGLSRFAELALGSTARFSIHQARVPVVAVPTEATWSSPAHVVVGIDGSTYSQTALTWALSNLPADACVHVVRAFAPWVGDGLNPLDLVADKGLHDAFRHETQQWVDAAFEQLEEPVLTPPVVEVKIGNARDVLIDPGYPVDLIVVGERGHTGIAAKVLGSVSDHLVRYADCPVLVVPDAEVEGP